MNTANSLRSINTVILTEANFTSTNMIMVKNYLMVTFADLSAWSTPPQLFSWIASSLPNARELHLLKCYFPKRPSLIILSKITLPCHSLFISWSPWHDTPCLFAWNGKSSEQGFGSSSWLSPGPRIVPDIWWLLRKYLWKKWKKMFLGGASWLSW